jgi:hypothetical protein
LSFTYVNEEQIVKGIKRLGEAMRRIMARRNGQEGRGQEDMQIERIPMV